jgi:hypothetical protein
MRDTPPLDATACPPAGELERLIAGRLPGARADAITAHLDHCPECTDRMEALASGGDPLLTTTVRQCVAERPPAGSAYWPALSAVAAEVSGAAVLPPPSARTPRPGSGEIKYAFLRPPEAPDRLGKLGQFDVIAEIGRGGMGVVLRAYDPCLQREVAVKVLDPQLADNEVARARFCREARAAAAVTHDNLVAVHQVDEDENSGLPFIVMQLVSGESLEQRLRRVGKLDPAAVARLGRQAAAGLAAAHAGGLIHRDIKPGNILLEGETDRAKLTDFGLARGMEDVKLTRTGFVAGTPLYMAPEQARGDDVDARADLFSLGSVLYEAAAGIPPFDGKTPLVVLKRVTDETQPPLRQVNPDVPVWLSDVVDRLLAKDPADRFQTAREVAEIFSTELARLHAGGAPAAAVAGLCDGPGTSAYALRRHVCWKSVALRVLPWVGGAIAGGLLVGLWPATPVRVEVPVPVEPPAVAAAPATEVSPEPRLSVPGKAGPVWSVAFTPRRQVARGRGRERPGPVRRHRDRGVQPQPPAGERDRLGARRLGRREVAGGRDRRRQGPGVRPARERERLPDVRPPDLGPVGGVQPGRGETGDRGQELDPPGVGPGDRRAARADRPHRDDPRGRVQPGRRVAGERRERRDGEAVGAGEVPGRGAEHGRPEQAGAPRRSGVRGGVQPGPGEPPGGERRVGPDGPGLEPHDRRAAARPAARRRRVGGELRPGRGGARVGEPGRDGEGVGDGDRPGGVHVPGRRPPAAQRPVRPGRPFAGRRRPGRHGPGVGGAVTGPGGDNAR